MNFSWETKSADSDTGASPSGIPMTPFKTLSDRLSAVLSDEAGYVKECVKDLLSDNPSYAGKDTYLEDLAYLLTIAGDYDRDDVVGRHMELFKRESADNFRDYNGQPEYEITRLPDLPGIRGDLYDLLDGILYQSKLSREWFYLIYHLVELMPYSDADKEDFKNSFADAVYEATVLEVGQDSPVFGVFAEGMSFDEVLNSLDVPMDVLELDSNTLGYRVALKRLAVLLANRFEGEYGYNPLEKGSRPEPPFGVGTDNPFGGSADNPFAPMQEGFTGGGYVPQASPFASTQDAFGKSNPFASTQGAFGKSNPFASTQGAFECSVSFGRPRFSFLGSHRF